MSSNNINPQNVLTAFQHLSDQLPTLIGESGWQAVGETIQTHVAALARAEDMTEQWLHTAQLMEAIAPYAEARTRVQTELYQMAEVREAVHPLLMDAAKQSSLNDVDASQVEQVLNAALQVISVTESIPDEEAFRTVEIDKGGVDGGKLVRAKNITLDYKSLLMFGAGAAINLAQPNPLLLTLGVLVAALELQNLAEVSINEQEATVFWGLLHACGRPHHPAKEHEVFARINQERTAYGLDELTDKEIQTSLALLTRLDMVERVDGRYPMWQFVESCRIRA
ncbi:MAG: hypothetical protein AAF639_36520 [Chloroflexota bacterium]